MQHRTRYWLTCPKCGHRMEIGTQGGPVRAKQCDKCNLLFILTNEERAAAESVGTAAISVISGRCEWNCTIASLPVVERVPKRASGLTCDGEKDR